MNRKEADRQEAIKYLQDYLKPKTKVFTSVKHVSRSGMNRSIACYVTTPDGIYNISHLVARAVEMPFDRDRGAVKIGGCGMDMGFAIVYELSYAMFKDGFGCIGEGCPSNDHSNGDRDYTPHKLYGLKPQCDHWHKDGGYCLKHEWI